MPLGHPRPFPVSLDALWGLRVTQPRVHPWVRAQGHQPDAAQPCAGPHRGTRSPPLPVSLPGQLQAPPRAPRPWGGLEDS